MTKRYLKDYVGCVPRTEYYLLVRGTHPTKRAAHVGWVKPPVFIATYIPAPPLPHLRERVRGEGARRTQQNLMVRWVSLRSTQPTFKLLCRVHVCGAVSDD